jgi:hypothetical protein
MPFCIHTCASRFPLNAIGEAVRLYEMSSLS